jgi:hypothetical protein
MRVFFAFRTYAHYGPNATQVLAAKWLNERISPDYGGNVGEVWIVGCCRNLSPPKKTLEELHVRYEASFKQLPHYSRLPESGGIELAYDAIRFTHEEIARDSQVLSAWTFRHLIGKATDLVREMRTWDRCPVGFDYQALADDIGAAQETLPSSVEGLVQIYNAFENEPT